MFLNHSGLSSALRLVCFVQGKRGKMIFRKSEQHDVDRRKGPLTQTHLSVSW